MNLQTVTQAAAALGISPRRVRQLISAGAIAAARAGGRLWLITPETLAEFARLERRAGRPRGSRSRGSRSLSLS